MAPQLDTTQKTRRVLNSGYWPVRIDKCEWRPNGNQGVNGRGSSTPTVHIEALVEGSEIEEANGVRLFNDQAFTENTQWAVNGFLEALFGPLEGDKDGMLDIDFDMCEGQQAYAKVELTSYEGRKRNQVNGWLHIDTEFGADGSPVLSEDEDIEIIGAS